MITYCDWHLGDQLVFLNWLRRVAASTPVRHVHFAPDEYLPQLREVVEDIHNIELAPLSAKPASAVDVWINRSGDHYTNPTRDDWAAHHIEHFARLARDLGVENPVTTVDDLLFDFPRLRAREYPAFDFLVINSAPHSEQFRGFNAAVFDILVAQLRDRGTVITTGPSYTGVPTTLNYDGRILTVADIGSLSINCKHIIGVLTGPVWATFNVWNKTVPRIFFSDREHVNLTPNTTHVTSINAALAHLPW